MHESEKLMFQVLFNSAKGDSGVTIFSNDWDGCGLLYIVACNL